MLIGNKTDNQIERVITYDEGALLAKEIGCLFFETSAVTGSNVMEAFKSMAKLCKDKLAASEGRQTDLRAGVTISGDNRRSKRCPKCSRRTESVDENVV